MGKLPVLTQLMPGRWVDLNGEASSPNTVDAWWVELNGEASVDEKLWCFRPLLCTLFMLNRAKQTLGIMK